MTINEFRYERKFLINGLSKEQVEAIVKLNVGMFKEIYYERKVNNIYLDSINKESFNDNVIGINKRKKVRIRWYDDFKGIIKNPILEFKIKNNDLGRKNGFKINDFKLDHEFSFKRFYNKTILKSNLPNKVIQNIKALNFSLMNSYTRKYFMSIDKKYRITIDSNLEYHKIDNNKNNFIKNIKDKNTIILELKYKLEDDNNVKKIINQLPFRVDKNSKYVTGVELLYH